MKKKNSITRNSLLYPEIIPKTGFDVIHFSGLQLYGFLPVVK